MKTLEFIEKALNYVDCVEVHKSEGFLDDNNYKPDLYDFLLYYRDESSYQQYMFASVNIKKAKKWHLYDENIKKAGFSEDYQENLKNLCEEYANTPVEER